MLRIALSSRSLFHMEDANELFEREGQAAYDAMMRAKEKEPLQPGMAFNLVKKLLALNTPGLPSPDRVEVVLLSRNSVSAGMRVMNSVEHYGLPIHRAVFTTGSNRFDYVKEFGADLFLSAKPDDTALALKNGIAAATMSTGASPELDKSKNPSQVRIAFDGDAVIFSDEADKVFLSQGLESFTSHEREKVDVPLPAGPFKRLLTKLCELQAVLPEGEDGEKAIRTGLVTARSVSASGRVINTLRTWGLAIDAVVFAGGAPKGPLLRAFGADFFIDDTRKHVESAHSHDIPAAQVPGTHGGIGGDHDPVHPGVHALAFRQVEQLAQAQSALSVSNDAMVSARADSRHRTLTKAAP